MYTTLPTERAAVLGAVPPQSVTGATATTGACDMRNFGRALAVVEVGAIAATGTVDAKLQKSADGSTGWTDITGSSITQFTDADDNKVALINLDTADLDGTRYIRLSITGAVAAALIGGVVLGFDPHYSPASDYDASLVDEIKTV